MLLFSVVGSVTLAACSDGDFATSTKVEALSAEVESIEQILEAVPEDGSDFQAEMGIDEDGKIIPGRITSGAGVVVPGFDPSSLESKLVEFVEPPREKVAPSLAAMLRSSDPKAVTEVVVSVAHDTYFSPLPKLRKDQPRSSTENTQRLTARRNTIAAVDALRKPFRTAVADHARSLGAVVTEELTMGNALAMTVPDSAVQALSRHPDVLEVIARYDGTPPPATISNGTSLSTGMNSAFWRPTYDGNLSQFYVVTFDTGVRSSHTVFNSPGGGTLHFHGECISPPPGFPNIGCNTVPWYVSDQDTYWNHGTAVANIIMGGNSSSAGFGVNFRGTSAVVLDYLNVYTNSGADALAVGRAFITAASWGDDIVVGELQFSASDASAMSLAADDAFDQGIAVISACGNNGVASAPASPGNAHKALSVGDYDAVTGAVVAQVPGLVDGRIKPDFQAPTNVDAAGNGSNTAKYLGFAGTSAATAFAGGAAAIMYEWYNVGFGLTNRPGNLYTALLAQGDGGTMSASQNGVGKLKMESGSWWWTGQITLGTVAVDLVFAVPAGRRNMKVAIWWPERQNQAHNDIDLRVLNPSGNIVGSSIWSGSVWEKVKQTGNLTPGNYTVRIAPYSMPRPNQVVYYTVITSYQ